MSELEYQLSFTTPAFLGNSEQKAQWRTPPIKALLRQWWRVVHAPTVHYDLHKLSTAEKALFGFAGTEGASRSQLRLRLSAWDAGKLEQWPAADAKVTHPEVKFPVGSQLYLGYGALDYDKATKATKLATSKASGQQRTAIDQGAQQTLSLRMPKERQNEIEQAVRLASWFGTVGSRSRNGWGAVALSAKNETAPIPRMTPAEVRSVLRPLEEALELDWPHAIGMSDDRRPLIWLTVERSGWREVMRDLAEIKIAFRTKFVFATGGATSEIEERHLLGYPVTNHIPKAWGNQKRLASQVRFKVVPSERGVRGVIVHLPCRMPDEMPLPAKLRQNQTGIWQRVHETLDDMPDRLCRLS